MPTSPRVGLVSCLSEHEYGEVGMPAMWEAQLALDLAALPWLWPVAWLMALVAWLDVLGDWMEVTLWPEI